MSIKFLKYRTFVKSLTGEQQAAVRSCGFGSLLHFYCKEAPRTVTFLLAERFDVPTRTVKLENGSSFQLNPLVVHQVLGVALGGWKIIDFASNSEKDIVANDTRISKVAPTVQELFSLVTAQLTGDRFVRVFMLISLSDEARNL